MQLGAKVQQTPEVPTVPALWGDKGAGLLFLGPFVSPTSSPARVSRRLLEAQGSVAAQPCWEKGAVDDTQMTEKLSGKLPVQTLWTQECVPEWGSRGMGLAD